jgi:4-hydroxy-tetrahydrodipicolinate synthase
LYSGDDATAIEFILMGGHGGISVTSNVAPREVLSAYQAAFEGDEKTAQEIEWRIFL